MVHAVVVAVVFAPHQRVLGFPLGERDAQVATGIELLGAALVLRRRLHILRCGEHHVHKRPQLHPLKGDRDVAHMQVITTLGPHRHAHAVGLLCLLEPLHHLLELLAGVRLAVVHQHFAGLGGVALHQHGGQLVHGPASAHQQREVVIRDFAHELLHVRLALDGRVVDRWPAGELVAATDGEGGGGIGERGLRVHLGAALVGGGH